MYVMCMMWRTLDRSFTRLLTVVSAVWLMYTASLLMSLHTRSTIGKSLRLWSLLSVALVFLGELLKSVDNFVLHCNNVISFLQHLLLSHAFYILYFAVRIMNCLSPVRKIVVTCMLKKSMLFEQIPYQWAMDTILTYGVLSCVEMFLCNNDNVICRLNLTEEQCLFLNRAGVKQRRFMTLKMAVV